MDRTESIYETPLVRVEVVSTECGFAASGFGEANQAGDSITESGDYSYNL